MIDTLVIGVVRQIDQVKSSGSDQASSRSRAL